MRKNLSAFLFLLMICFSNYVAQAEYSVEGVEQQSCQSFFIDSFHKAMSNSPSYKVNVANACPYWQAAKKLYDTYAVQDLQYSPTPRIPKIIHQIWLGSRFPEKYIHFQNTWKEHHPDWEYKLWTEKEIEEFGLTNKAAYDESTNYGQKSDIARYEILYRIGGLYVDTDFECFKNFDILHHCFDFYMGTGDVQFFLVYMGLIGSAPGNKILKKCIDSINIHATHHADSIVNILQTTGPQFFTKIIQQFLNDSNVDLKRSVLFPVNYFFPLPYTSRNITYRETRKWIKPESFAMHHWFVSWNNGIAPGAKPKK